MATPEQYMSIMSNTVSRKQMELLRIIARGNPDGSYVSKTDILARCSYTDKLDTVSFALRYMLAQGRIEKTEHKVISNKKVVMHTYRLTKVGEALIKSDDEGGNYFRH